MELQFQKKQIPYLHTLKRELQNQEQTQELRISDGMPDIGSVIGAWGQVILRSKEWENDGMRVSGGTMVWVQYTPEDGGQPQLVDCWIPFQLRWPFAPTQFDGNILAQCLLRSVDARMTSARKLMVRTNVSVLAQGMQLQLAEIFEPPQLPEDIQLQTLDYPILLPVEAGEKTFTMEDTLSLPPSAPRMDTLLSCRMTPQVTEQKLMGDKLVFRGNTAFHLLYLGEDGSQYGWELAVPFSQYSELDREYDQDARVDFWPCVTTLETEQEDAQIRVKVGLVFQYRICHRPVIRLVTDAYALNRTLKPQVQTLELPGILEQRSQLLHPQWSVPAEGLRVVDTQYLPQPVVLHTQTDTTELEVPALFQTLYYDMEGNLRSASGKWEETIPMEVGQGSHLEATLWPEGTAQGSLLSGNLQTQADLRLEMETVLETGISMIAGLELEEAQSPDPARPSLILRKSGDDSLWQIAKVCGSTVEAIRQANDLSEEPEPTQMLLIPVK